VFRLPASFDLLFKSPAGGVSAARPAEKILPGVALVRVESNRTLPHLLKPLRFSPFQEAHVAQYVAQ